MKIVILIICAVGSFGAALLGQRIYDVIKPEFVALKLLAFPLLLGGILGVLGTIYLAKAR